MAGNRAIWLHDSLLGFQTYPSNGDLPNFAKALMLTAQGADGQGCVSVQAAGGLGSTLVGAASGPGGEVTIEAASVADCG